MCQLKKHDYFYLSSKINMRFLVQVLTHIFLLFNIYIRFVLGAMCPVLYRFVLGFMFRILTYFFFFSWLAAQIMTCLGCCWECLKDCGKHVKDFFCTNRKSLRKWSLRLAFGWFTICGVLIIVFTAEYGRTKNPLAVCSFPYFSNTTLLV